MDNMSELDSQRLENEKLKSDILKEDLKKRKKDSTEKEKSSQKVGFDGFKRSNLSKKEIAKFNQAIDEEVKKLDKLISEADVKTEEYQKLLSTRASLLNQRIEKEPSKIVEHGLRYGLPVLASVVVTGAYLGMQDPSQEGRTWFSTLKDMLRFRN